MKQRWFVGAVLVFVAVSMMAVGCGGGGSDRPALGKVTCEITVNGKALTKGSVMFTPDKSAGTKGRPSHGVIKDGKCAGLTCFDPGDGAIIGTHKVSIHATKTDPNAPQGEDAMAEAAPGMVKELIPPQFNAKTTIQFKVEAGKANVFKKDLKIPGFEMP